MSAARRVAPAFVVTIGTIATIAGLSIIAHSQSNDLDVEIETGRTELAGLEKRIRDSAARIEELTDTEGDIEARLAALEKGVAAAKELAGAYDRQLGRLRAEIARLIGEETEAAARVEETRSRLSDHLRLIHRRGKAAYIEILLGADDFGAALRRARYVTAVLGAERELMRQHTEARDRHRAALAERNERERELEGLKADQDREAKRLSSLEAERAATLDRVRRERRDEEDALEAMEASAKKLEDLIERLEEERAAAARGGARGTFRPGRPLTEARGALPWPVQGRVISGFGTHRHPRFGTSTFNPGVDIAAPAGTPVRAIAPGQVEFTDWVNGYGKTIIVSHGNGFYSLYAHTSDVLVAVGDRVDAGTVIARVGSTDSLRGDCLHFELRQGGEAVNPMTWLGRR